MQRIDERAAPSSPPSTGQARQRVASPSKSPGRPEAVLILGMHRSGTSAVSRVVGLLGADLPANLLPAAADNESGFWESADLVALDEDILASAGSHWHDWRQLNPDWIRSPVAAAYKDRAIAILRQEFADSAFFVLKDPRLCRLLPFWLDILETFGARTKCLITFRNPLAVAASLKARNGFSPAKSHALWLRHVLEAEHWTRDLPRAFVSFDELVDDWRAALDKASKELAIAWPRRSATADAQIDRFLEHRLRHHRSDLPGLQGHPGVADWVKDAYAALIALGANPAAQPPLPVLDRLLAQFDTASEVLGALVGDEELALREREARIDELEQAVAAHRAHIGELELAVGEREGRIGELGSAIEAHEAHVKDLEGAVGQREARIEELESSVSARQAHIGELTLAKAERETRVAQLERAVAARESHVEDLELAVASRDALLAGVESTLTRIRAELSATRAQRRRLASRLNEVQQSASWQLARPVHWLERRWAGPARSVAALLKLAWWGIGLRLPSRLRLRRDAQAVVDSGLFDEIWYTERNPDVAAGDFSPSLHWLTIGWQEGRDPCPCFDTGWYLTQNPDVAAAGLNPLVHFLASGAAEGRKPCALFDTRWYRDRYPDAARGGMNPLAHFLRAGAAEGRKPCPLFDTEWYLAQNPDVAEAAINPLDHYLQVGAAEGRDPNALFDSDWYLQQNADVARAGMNPLVHYLLRGAEEGRNPSPSFDTRQYLAHHPEAAQAGINPLVHCLETSAENRLAQTPIRAPGRAPAPPPLIEVDASNRKAIAATLRFEAGAEPIVSVVIPAFNKVDYTLACLASIQGPPPRTPFEIIVVDDCSTDQTQVLLGEIPGMGYLRNGRNLGFLLSANHGASVAKGRYLMFLNNDTQVTPGWLDELVRVFEMDPDAGLAGSKLIYPSGHLQEAGVALNRDGTADLVGLNDHPEKPEYNFLREVDHCSGAAFLLEKAVFDELGGFDERYAPAYYEDCDLSLKIRASGKKVIYQPGSSIIHHLSVTTAELPAGKMARIEANKETFLARWQGALEELNRIRLLAFYLPQFHPIAENDEWWGKGFTEWTNVVKAQPQFEGHYQPHLPADLGFYDLRLEEAREAQAALARQYGVYGFCYYYYWFSGKRLLERPLAEMLASGKPDFPFCICWANENWTRRWDGQDDEVLIGQGYSPENDHAFIEDVLPILRDRRYIRVRGKPLLLVYRVGLLPQPLRTVSVWRDQCRKCGLGEIYLAAVQSFDATEDPRTRGFDAAVEFPPHGARNAETVPPAPLVNPDFDGVCYDYRTLVASYLERGPVAYTRFRTVMPSWDNTARRKNTPHIFVNSTPELYEQWLREAAKATRRFNGCDERILFVNAWNEWAEGNHLEPDQEHGHAFLGATRRALTNANALPGAEPDPPINEAAPPPDIPRASPAERHAPGPPDVTLLGHPFAPSGRGEDIRAQYRALRAVGIEARVVDVYESSTPDPDVLAELEDHLAKNAGAGINIYHINGDEVEPCLAHLAAAKRFNRGSHDIVYPAWELSRYPADWAAQLDRFDEVWAPSRFTYESIAREVTVSVAHLSLPSEVRISRRLDRRYFGISEKSTLFLFFFDFTSFVARKNPFAALRAFDLLLQRRPDADVEFVVKLSGSTQRPGDLSAFHRRIADHRGKVRIIDRTLGDNEMKNLIRCCDCFVSLHRSEGFGRGLSEAMSLGKPVIATGYSGNMDFMTPENALLVDYRLVPVHPGSYPRFEGQVWAEADVEQAAEHMVRLIDDPPLRSSIGEKARSDIARSNGYRSVGLRYQERIGNLIGSADLLSSRGRESAP